MKSNIHWLWRNVLPFAIASTLFGGVVPAAFGQIEGATIAGKVLQQQTDSKAAGVTVTATNKNRGYSKTTKTRGDGSYIFIGLRPGVYLIKVADNTSEPVTLRVGQRATVNITLPAPDDDSIERITVSGVRVESFSGGEVGTNITPEMIARLPQNNRIFYPLPILRLVCNLILTARATLAFAVALNISAM